MSMTRENRIAEFGSACGSVCGLAVGMFLVIKGHALSVEADNANPYSTPHNEIQNDRTFGLMGMVSGGLMIGYFTLSLASWGVNRFRENSRARESTTPLLAAAIAPQLPTTEHALQPETRF